MTRFILPLILFLALAGTLAVGLWRGEPPPPPSPLVGRAVPAFDLPVLDGAPSRFGPQQLKGQVWLLNVWASWCVSCREEHPVLLDQVRGSGVPLVGLQYQDKAEPGKAWLSQHGNPYRLTAVDPDGRAGLDLGVIGVPETFVIDKQGRVRHRFAGPLTPQVWQETLWPLIKELQGA